MFRVPLATSSTVVPVDNFWGAVWLYHNRPHLINRKLAAISTTFLARVDTQLEDLDQYFTREALVYELRKSDNSSDLVRNILEVFDKNLELVPVTENELLDNYDSTFVSVSTLLPRGSMANKCTQVSVLNKKNNRATFIQESSTIAPNFAYHLELNQGNLVIVLNSFEDADTPSALWLADKLFPKLLKWYEHNPDDNIIQSLNLIENIDKYCTLYNDLKVKYGDHLVKSWPQNASTDPKKYVFEDLAIAAYLICLWQQKKEENVRFVDCGCGNGLLVHILNREGYHGYGLDIRRRKIWDLFDTDLRIGTVTPESTFPESNWLIGNHLDELTPWLPVLALRSSPRVNFFVLPCCFYDFSGQKYVRSNTGISQYSDYLNYIEDISRKCGFRAEIDKLRIPSTKRTCIVGTRDRIPDQSEYSNMMADVNKLIESRNSSFTPRVPIDRVRNCTKLNRELITRIVNLCVETLLNSCDNSYARNFRGEPWNKGGPVSLCELSKIVPKDDLKMLKCECGGLQTLLKNHRFLFCIESGVVSLREPLLLTESSSKYRDKPCWFFRNHPDGCIYEAKNCASHH